METNPLLSDAGLPRFGAIRPAHVEAAVAQTLERNRAALQALLRDTPAGWEETLLPLEELEERLQRTWAPVVQLHKVADSDALRQAYKRTLPKVEAYRTELRQNRRLMQAYLDVSGAPAYQDLGCAERQLISNALRDFRLNGVELEPAGRARFSALRQELSSAENQFRDNVLDATGGWCRHVTDEDALSGIPAPAKALAAKAASDRGRSGWVLTLEQPSYLPVMGHADDRALRFELYRAHVTRASDLGPDAGRWDNSELMTRIVQLRARLAGLLGYHNFAAYALATRMAHSPQEVLDFLGKLIERTRPIAAAEFAALEEFARRRHGLRQLEAWDQIYFSEKLRKHRFGITQEELRPYFPLSRVLRGLFTVVERLYGFSVEWVDDAEVWHPHVRLYRVNDAQGERRGLFYLDPYARAGKQSGAWLGQCVARRRSARGLQLPVAFLNCNFSTPGDDREALLTHTEMVTLFHEFGHGLHHILTLVDRPAVAGLNGVPWDAIELPSQFMESWCWERETIDLTSAHHETGAPLDDRDFERLRAARHFHSGLNLLRQLELALFDFRLHVESGAAGAPAVQQVLDEVRRQVAVVRYPEFNRFQHAFTHIFSGGYAAGYYSYKWAEVLAADAFSKFEETGIFNRQTGAQFLHGILEQGGSRDPMELFVEFRGREPRMDALLRRHGIVN